MSEIYMLTLQTAMFTANGTKWISKKPDIEENPPTTKQPINVKAQKIPQYVAGLSAQFGALAAGLILGWTFSCGPNGARLSKEYDLTITVNQFSWIGSAATLGAAAICFPIGVVSDTIGRKKTLLITVIPVTIGWGLIIFATSVEMLYVGRFLTGFAGGSFSLIAPLYTSEIAENSIRGRLGAFYEMFITSGILLSYLLVYLVKEIYWVSLTSATVPIIFCCIFTFMPETPIYYLKKDKEQCALFVLGKLRGLDYDVKGELQQQKAYLQFLKMNYSSRWSILKKKTTLKGMMIIYGLMFIQQMSGTNAFVFYSSSIFEDAQVDSSLATITLGCIMVVAASISSICIDTFGRKPLLMLSSGVMCVSLVILGTYFYLISQANSGFAWVPVVSLCIGTFTNEIGLGPVPFVMIGEIFESRIQGFIGSTACCLNWLLAFFVTKYFAIAVGDLGEYVTCWFFSAICGAGVIFVYLFVIETKNKSLQQIQMEMDVRWI